MNNFLKLFLISTLIAGCGDFSDVFTPRHEEAKFQLQDDDPKDLPLEFASVQRVILNDNCVACHSTYNNYQKINRDKDKILERMTTTNLALKMPPQNRAQLKTSQIQFFEDWIEAGAPQFDQKRPGPVPPPEPEPAQVSFAQIKEQVLKANQCIACHSHYTDYAAVRKDLGKILPLVNDNSMPFPQKKGMEAKVMPQEGKDLLALWDIQGAPEFAHKPAEALPEVKLEPTWISLKNNVFGPKCIACHNQWGSRGAGAMDTYTNLMAWYQKASFIFNTDPAVPDEHGDFVTAILNDPEDPLAFPSGMPSYSVSDVKMRFPRVTPEEVEVIKTWIKAGLPTGFTEPQ